MGLFVLGEDLWGEVALCLPRQLYSFLVCLAWHYGVFACGFLERKKHEEREDSVGEGNGCKKRIIRRCLASY